ncbi:MAG: bifunctional diaminohydroxyphosphoribosylaminopyrimidine deaminase/5-amino-6-(5-phosphoribosylamino)uracil reductase RibD [Nitrospirae bacterium]|nr:MAG: bifunctional diaminohydroxyphosphoribosylaminopyrimidine deaminase/5-amino-6-(5-phosphoribosylamino)uracil reductase RibD [Nitrospirota bacterium]
MQLALRLAAKGRGRTHPNPMVGAVIVRNGSIVGTGYHRRAGEPHAEILALQQAGSHARGATLYVTLEPCCHRNKRTPPCVPALIEAGLRRIVVAMLDPNPHVNGLGIRALQRAGITVEVGCLEAQATRLNEAYIHWMRTGRPFVILKAAMTLDGKIATAAGESKWITGEEARQHAHRIRRSVDAILVGIGTVLKDDPQLSARGHSPDTRLKIKQPVRVILDSRLRIPLRARVCQGIEIQPTYVVTTVQAPARKIAVLESRGVRVVRVRSQRGHVSLKACLQTLGRWGMRSVLIEGGSLINADALRLRLIDRILLYVAPRLLGGQDAIGVFGGQSPKSLRAAIAVQDVSTRFLGRDLLITGRVET